MSSTVIVDQVYKKYSKDLKHSSRYGLRSLYREILGQDQGGLELRESEFFAVSDLSFSLNQGDSIALVGRNGCGKTTTLRMLNGLIKPDHGRITMKGRVQALIALGAGFNPVLSGRENAFLSAATLGLSRNQMNQKMDEIISFSELEEFIDSPVQSYSSGMYARLGFSVAIHLDPDILLIDEILSVGDFAFQNKCFSKMQEFKKNGVTIILVSHNLTQVRQVCENSIWMEKGQVKEVGPSHEVVTHYLDSVQKKGAQKEKQSKKDSSAQETIYGPIKNDLNNVDEIQIAFHQENSNEAIHEVNLYDQVKVHFEFQLKKEVEDLNVSLAFYRKQDGMHMTTISTLNGNKLSVYNSGKVKKQVIIDQISFSPNQSYVLVVCIHEGRSYLHRDIEYEFFVKGDGRMHWGVTDLKYDWVNE